jgi:hypothetical protein
MVRVALLFETAAALFLRAGNINPSADLQMGVSGRKTDGTTPKISISGAFFMRQWRKKW